MKRRIVISTALLSMLVVAPGFAQKGSPDRDPQGAAVQTQTQSEEQVQTREQLRQENRQQTPAGAVEQYRYREQERIKNAGESDAIKAQKKAQRQQMEQIRDQMQQRGMSGGGRKN